MTSRPPETALPGATPADAPTQPSGWRRLAASGALRAVPAALLAMVAIAGVALARPAGWPLWVAGLLLAWWLQFGIQRAQARRWLQLREQHLAAQQTIAEQARQLDELEHARRRSMKLASDRGQFVAAASHDLRQPMHAVGLFVAALMAEPLGPPARLLVERLGRSLRGLDELFDRLLDISRLDSGNARTVVRDFAPEPLAQTLEARFSAPAQSRGLRLRVRCGRGLMIRSDPALLTELLMNLLSNAIRYTDRGSILLAFRPAGDQVRILVADTGRGIAAADQQRVFDEFVQLDNPARDRRRGVGLGLAIVRRLAAALEHPVALRSEPGRGTCFEVRVPRLPRAVADAMPELPADDGQALAGLLVLVVEDEVDVLAGMDALLTAWGCYALLARSAEEAVGCVQDSPRFPDLILTDHELGPAQTSNDVLAAVLAMLPEPVPVLVLSGSSDDTLAARTAAAGHTWLAKPVAPVVLRAQMIQALASGPPLTT